jgi:hypothetical protein
MYRRTNLTMYWRTNLTMYWRTNAVMQLCIGVGKACIYFPTSVYILAWGGGGANASISQLSLTLLLRLNALKMTQVLLQARALLLYLRPY